MRRELVPILLLAALINSGRVLGAQEASSGLDLRATLSGLALTSNGLTEPPRSGAPGTAGSRSLVYPVWKISDNWFVSGALQFVTKPYFYEDFSDTSYGAKGYVLQASLNYSRVSDKGSVLVRAGQLSTVFGSFLLRYDDADNPLVDLPIEYGYYYAPVSTEGVAGGEMDATRGKWDGRVQFANSSPANPRSLFAHDQYGNWAGGGGYTIRQGFRLGVSAYRGPYLNRQYKFFYPGEAPPNTLPAHAVGLDAAWARNHTSVQGELQHFFFPYTVVPDHREWAAYAELKQVLSPRWYIAGRTGLTYANGSQARNFETAAAYRPNRIQLLKFDYEIEYRNSGSLKIENTLAVQLVTTLHGSLSPQSFRKSQSE
jgi:hypothetical protein